MKKAVKEYRLTQYSHGAGCGCKLSPGVLSEILKDSGSSIHFHELLVGNDTKDDAAVVMIDEKTAIVSTTDFFMPIVDDAFDFGAIASANAISDIYAMGGTPIMAIAILGWPINKIPASVAGEVMKGARQICDSAGIPLAGGHSIDAPEPIFGLAVTGKISIDRVKRNADGQVGDLLYLTKPIGIGTVTTAQKKGLADSDDLSLAKVSMTSLNKIGADICELPYVHGLTDVTGFGLGGHLLELCQGSGLGAEIFLDQIPLFPFTNKYFKLGCVPGGTKRNWETYGEHISLNHIDDYKIIADPQTSGGLLISVDPAEQAVFESFMSDQSFEVQPIGKLVELDEDVVIKVL